MQLMDLKKQGIDIQENIPLSRFTFTKTGGPAQYLAFPKNLDELKILVETVKTNNLPLTVIGNASNLIIRDGGISGLVLILTKMDEIVANQEEANAYGVFPGDVIIPESETILTANQKNVISKAWDNRYGVLMIRELLENVKDQELNNTLIAGANVQEEVGLRGAHVSTTKFDPEVFFAVDCSPAGDIYGNQGKVGNGTLIRFFDPGHIMLPNMKDFLLTTAEEAGIKYQYYCAAGGTDAGAAHLQNAGVPSTTIGVCARYIHSHQTLYAMDDFLEAQAFLQAIVKKLDRSTVDLIKNY